MELTLQEELAAQSIGAEALGYLKQTWTPDKLAQETEQRAVRVLEDILNALNNVTLEDPECFYRIEAILNTLEENGIYLSTRHDW